MDSKYISTTHTKNSYSETENGENNFNPNNIPRCPFCNIICSINLLNEKGISIIEYECEENHKGKETLTSFLKKSRKHSIYKEQCYECNQNQEEGISFFICSQCKYFICEKCLCHHNDGINHIPFIISKFDSICCVHSNLYSYYCKNCKMNLCVLCKDDHIGHDLIELSKLKITSEEKKDILKNISDVESIVKNIEELKNEFIKFISAYQDSNLIEIKFLKYLFDTYEYNEMRNNMNYNIYNNLKSCNNKFKLTRLKTFDQVYNKLLENVSLLKDIQQGCIKTINDNKEWISHLELLKDGRIASSSGDGTIKIYKNDNSFNLDLIINEHNEAVNYFTQLINEKIITCSSDKTIKIIKLNESNSYNIEETLTEHSSSVDKILSPDEEFLISLSKGGEMKFWLTNETNSNFYCDRTITFQSQTSNCDGLILNQNEFVTLSLKDKILNFYNIGDSGEDGDKISSINNIDCIGWDILCILDNNNILCVGGESQFYLIEINSHNVIKNINLEKNIYSIISNGYNIIYAGVKDKEGYFSIYKYSFEKESLSFDYINSKDKAHSQSIVTLLLLPTVSLASGSDDNTIKIWI